MSKTQTRETTLNKLVFCFFLPNDVCVCLCAHVCTQHIYKVSLTSQFDNIYELVNSAVTSTRIKQENFLKNKSYSPDITMHLIQELWELSVL